MKKFLSIILLVFTTVLMSSCDFIFDFRDTTIVYVVKSRKVNLRKAPSDNAEIIDTKAKGDTIIPVKRGYAEWIATLHGEDTAYVFTKNLKILSIPTEALEKKEYLRLSDSGKKVIAYLDEHITWDSLTFWGIAIALGILTMAMVSVSMYVDKKIMFWKGRKRYKKDDMIPYIYALLGFLFGIAYAFWKFDVHKAIFIEPFWILGGNNGVMAWYLILLSLAAVSVFGYSIYVSVKTFGKYFLLHTIFFVILSSIMFLTAAVITMAMIYIAIAIIILVAGYSLFSGLTQPSPYSHSEYKRELGIAMAEYNEEQRAKLKEQRELDRIENQ